MKQATQKSRINVAVEVSTAHWIDGKRIESERNFEVISPIDCSHIADVSAGGAEEIEAAVAAARRAFPAWVALGPEGRHPVLHRVGNAIQHHGRELAVVETIDNGSLLTANIQRMMPRSALNITFFADWALMSTRIAKVNAASTIPVVDFHVIGRARAIESMRTARDN